MPNSVSYGSKLIKLFYFLHLLPSFFLSRKSKATVKSYDAHLKSEPGREYLMNHKNRGKCVIFSHRHFDSKTLNERRGTELDANALMRAFTHLGFEVIIYNDSTASEIGALLEAISKEDHSDSDCFACCIMTHGDEENLWAKDDKYPVEFPLNFFEADNCPTLDGKPKLFFIQACRGDKLGPGIILKVGQDETYSATHYTIPAWADFLISYSTDPGYCSWRNTQDGSWFMQSLAQMIVEYASFTPFLSVITKVNAMAAYDIISQVPGDKEYDKQKQVPSTNHTLTRELIFRPKDPPEKLADLQMASN